VPKSNERGAFVQNVLYFLYFMFMPRLARLDAPGVLPQVMSRAEKRGVGSNTICGTYGL